MVEDGRVWQCCRQRAGPLTKECRAIRPRLSPYDTRADAKSKREIQKSAHSAVCRSQVDRLELRLALFGYEGSHYTLTFDPAHLPRTFQDTRKAFRAFRARLLRWRKDIPYDWISALEGKHGDHRFHVHMILRDSDFSPTEVRWLWKQGEVDEEPVLLKEGGYRRLAEYLNKERPDGFVIPIGRHPWSCSRSLSQKIPPPERWTDCSSAIEIPDDVLWARRGQVENDFGAYYYGSWIAPKNNTMYRISRAQARAHVNLEI